MKKVLVISYYFPPAGYAGGLRAAKFVKYLPENGWIPLVLTSKSPHLEEDTSLLNELPSDLKIFKTLSLDHDMLLKLLGKTRKEVFSSTLKPKSIVKLESFFLLPDTKALWFYTAILKALKIIREENVDVIFSTSPPLTSHLIAVISGRISRIPVVLDYRDAWYEDPFGIFPTKIHGALIKEIERMILKQADYVVAINNMVLSGRSKLTRIRGTVIPHGFDPEDFPEVKPLPEGNKMKMAYAGSVTYITNPHLFIRAFMGTDLPDSELHFFTTPTKSLVELTKSCNRIKWRGFLNHKELVKVLPEFHILIVTIDKDARSPYVFSSKIFDYIGAGRPIMVVAPPETYLWKYVSNFEFVYLVNPLKLGNIKQSILRVYTDWKHKRLRQVPEHIRKKFNRREQARELAKIFEEVIR